MQEGLESPPRTPLAYSSQMRANVGPKDPTRGQCQGKRPHGRSIDPTQDRTVLNPDVACTPDEPPQLGVSVVVCMAWLARCCGHGVCVGMYVLGLGPNAAWYSAGGREVKRKDSGGEPPMVRLLTHLAGLSSHHPTPHVINNQPPIPVQSPSRTPKNDLYALLKGREAWLLLAMSASAGGAKM